VHFGSDDLAAEDVHENVAVVVSAKGLAAQIGYVPRPDLTGASGRQVPRPAVPLRFLAAPVPLRFLAAPVPAHLFSFQKAVHIGVFLVTSRCPSSSTSKIGKFFPSPPASQTLFLGLLGNQHEKKQRLPSVVRDY
jgi:hypothetical protein